MTMITSGLRQRAAHRGNPVGAVDDLFTPGQQAGSVDAFHRGLQLAGRSAVRGCLDDGGAYRAAAEQPMRPAG